jgi:hypothetical protein
VAFLLRAGFSGFPVPGDYWQDASDYASTHFGKPGVSFADAHAAIAHVMAGNDETLRRQQQNLDGPAMDQVKFVADAFSAFRDSRWQDAVDALAPVMSSHERLGGSRAQRDLLELAVATALRKLGKDDEANRLLSMRRPLLTQMIATPH